MIKFIKKFLTIFLITFILLFNFFIDVSPVYANSQKFMRVLSENVYLYADNACTQKLFEIPKTYYLKIEGENGEFARVSYGNDNGVYPVIMGYAKISELTACDYIPLKPFAVTKVATCVQDILFNDSNKKHAFFNVPIDSVMVFYGEYLTPDGSELIFVYYQNKLGYLDKSSVNAYAIPDNQDPIQNEQTPSDEPPSENQEQGENLTSTLAPENLQIIIIVGLSVISISIVYALFRPTRNKLSKKQNEYFEESE